MTRAQTWRSFSLPVRMLVINQFGVNLGFYMLVPFLAAYLTDDLRLGLIIVGVVLGARNLAQQGMFLIGGTLADRLGSRPVIIAGCLLRVVGFGLFGIGQSLPWLLGASLLSGLAGALFNPAVRSYIATAADDRRAEAFSLFAISGNAGNLAGPLVGAALLMVDFQLVAAIAAAVFAVLTVVQLRWLPAQEPGKVQHSVLGGWRIALTDVRFVAFTIAGSSLFSLQNQLYFLLPQQADRAVGGQLGTVLIFAISTILAIATQVPVTRFVQRAWGPHRSIMVGLTIIGAGFAVPAVLSAVLPFGTAPYELGVVVLATVALTLGVVVAQPFLLERISEHAPAGLTGTYYGVFYLISGLTAAISSAAIGAAIGISALLPWAICAALGLGCAALAGCRFTAPLNHALPSLSLKESR